MARASSVVFAFAAAAVAWSCGPSPPSTTGTSSTTGNTSTTGSSSTAGTTVGEPTSGGATGSSTTGTGTTTGTSTSGGLPGTTTGTTGTTTGEPGSTSTGTSTGTTTTSTSSSSSTGTTGNDPAVPCQAPTGCEPIFLDDTDHQATDLESGWVLCNEGTVYYRQEVVDCAHPVFWPACDGEPGECSKDADCGGGSMVCANIYGDCYCTSQCMSDSDCEKGEICMCAGHGKPFGWLSLQNTCIPANCAVPDDCSGECGCRGSQFFCGTIDSAACPTDDDACSDDADCPGGKYCAWDPQQSHWVCQEYGICE